MHPTIDGKYELEIKLNLFLYVTEFDNILKLSSEWSKMRIFNTRMSINT
jgi:hypothetical protein